MSGEKCFSNGDSGTNVNLQFGTEAGSAPTWPRQSKGGLVCGWRASLKGESENLAQTQVTLKPNSHLY